MTTRTDRRAATPPSRLFLVSERQHEALYWRSLGLTVAQVAREMFLSENTVKELLRKLHRNLDVVSGPESVRVGFELGLLGPRPREFRGSVYEHLAALRRTAFERQRVVRCAANRSPANPEPRG